MRSPERKVDVLLLLAPRPLVWRSLGLEPALDAQTRPLLFRLCRNVAGVQGGRL